MKLSFLPAAFIASFILAVGLAVTWSFSMKQYGTMSSEALMPKYESNPTLVGVLAMGLG